MFVIPDVNPIYAGSKSAEIIRDALNQRVAYKKLTTSPFGLKFFLEVPMPNWNHLA